MSNSINNISIIIPMYNAETFLIDCLNSIYIGNSINESYFEVICVNDCSTDNSREIVLDYQKKHTNIRLIDHQENQKAGGARNTGTAVAKGEWIWFVDADDTIEPDALKKILYYCQNDDLDALCFNYQLLYEDRTVVADVFNDSMDVQNGVDFLLSTFSGGLIYHLGFPWRTIYRREMLIEHSVWFPKQLLYGEDTTFMVEGIMHSHRVKAISDVLYNYRQNVATSSSAQLLELKGERIYESIVSAGILLLNLKSKIQEISPKLAIVIDAGMPWFLNRLFMRLARTTAKERSCFYRALRNQDITHLRSYMNLQNRLIVMCPFTGKIMLWIISIMYMIKTRIRCYKLPSSL